MQLPQKPGKQYITGRGREGKKSRVTPGKIGFDMSNNGEYPHVNKQSKAKQTNLTVKGCSFSSNMSKDLSESLEDSKVYPSQP